MRVEIFPPPHTDVSPIPETLRELPYEERDLRGEQDGANHGSGSWASHWKHADLGAGGADRRMRIDGRAGAGDGPPDAFPAVCRGLCSSLRSFAMTAASVPL